MKIYIPTIDFTTTNRISLFILTRPFWTESGWSNNSEYRLKWNIPQEYSFTNNLSEATVYFIPTSIKLYSKTELDVINSDCIKQKIKAYGYIGGDFGEDFGNYSHIVFFRMGGFKSQLLSNNKCLPVSLSDHFERIYKKTEIDVREKQNLPTVGFCGHSDLSQIKKLKENLKFLKENTRRFFKNPFRKDYEPLFPSAFERAKLLQSFEKSNQIKSNFIYRKHYRAGAVTESERKKTALEYYDNIKNSDYVLCVRGAGNFSVRLYETLIMGRIPIFVNTDCLLPFEDKINWKNHVVWVEWKDRKNIVEIVADFHRKLSDEDFKKLQVTNRKLWKETLSVGNMLKIIEAEMNSA